MFVRRRIEPITLQGLVSRPVPSAEQDQEPGMIIVFRRNAAGKTDSVDPEVHRKNIYAAQEPDDNPNQSHVLFSRTAPGSRNGERRQNYPVFGVDVLCPRGFERIKFLFLIVSDKSGPASDLL